MLNIFRKTWKNHQNLQQFSTLLQNYAFDNSRVVHVNGGNTQKRTLKTTSAMMVGTPSDKKTDSDKKTEKQANCKLVPQLGYMLYPWQYISTKINLWRLCSFWDRDLVAQEFIRGAKQAATLMMDIIRTQDLFELRFYTTPLGNLQIATDMMISANDFQLKLIKFEVEHLRLAIPKKVKICTKNGRRVCAIDMVFIGLRNTKDFDTVEEEIEMQKLLEKYDVELPPKVLNAPHRVIFAEIVVRFERDYTIEPDVGVECISIGDASDHSWWVDYFRISSLRVLNYDSL